MTHRQAAELVRRKVVAVQCVACGGVVLIPTLLPCWTAVTPSTVRVLPQFGTSQISHCLLSAAKHSDDHLDSWDCSYVQARVARRR